MSQSLLRCSRCRKIFKQKEAKFVDASSFNLMMKGHIPTCPHCGEAGFFGFEEVKQKETEYEEE